jgi:hypothetical protein
VILTVYGYDSVGQLVSMSQPDCMGDVSISSAPGTGDSYMGCALISHSCRLVGFSSALGTVNISTDDDSIMSVIWLAWAPGSDHLAVLLVAGLGQSPSCCLGSQAPDAACLICSIASFTLFSQMLQPSVCRA